MNETEQPTQTDDDLTIDAISGIDGASRLLEVLVGQALSGLASTAGADILKATQSLAGRGLEIGEGLERNYGDTPTEEEIDNSIAAVASLAFDLGLATLHRIAERYVEWETQIESSLGEYDLENPSEPS